MSSGFAALKQAHKSICTAVLNVVQLQEGVDVSELCGSHANTPGARAARRGSKRPGTRQVGSLRDQRENQVPLTRARSPQACLVTTYWDMGWREGEGKET